MPSRVDTLALAASLLLGASLPALAGSRPVVVELFTSEGCSSCPRAEAYLNRLAAAGRRDDAAVSLVRDGGGIAVHVGAGQGSGRILLVGFDRQHRTVVRRGENAGRTITESDVVRSLRTLGNWSGAPVDLRSPAPAGDDAALLLEAPDGRVLGAARLGG